MSPGTFECEDTVLREVSIHGYVFLEMVSQDTYHVMRNDISLGIVPGNIIRYNPGDKNIYLSVLLHCYELQVIKRNFPLENKPIPNAVDCPPVEPRNKYDREIKPGVWVDVYDVLDAFDVKDAAFAHAIKKLLACGVRGHKDEAEDRKDILASVLRSNEIFNRKNN